MVQGFLCFDRIVFEKGLVWTLQESSSYNSGPSKTPQGPEALPHTQAWPLAGSGGGSKESKLIILLRCTEAAVACSSHGGGEAGGQPLYLIPIGLSGWNISTLREPWDTALLFVVASL